MRTILPISMLCLLIFLAVAAVSQPGPQQPARALPGPLSGDDEPIIIADTHSLPLETQAAASAVALVAKPPYRFIYSPDLKVDPNGKNDQIYNGTRQIAALFVCTRDVSGKYFAIKEVDLAGQKEGELHIWNGKGLTGKVKLIWTGGNKFVIDRGGHAFEGDMYNTYHTALDIDYPIRQARRKKLGSKDDDFKRSDTDDNDFRIVIHYCTSSANCTLEYLRQYDPCASSLPPTLAIKPAAKR